MIKEEIIIIIAVIKGKNLFIIISINLNITGNRMIAAITSNIKGVFITINNRISKGRSILTMISITNKRIMTTITIIKKKSNNINKKRK